MITTKKLLTPFIDEITAFDFSTATEDQAFNHIKPILKQWVLRDDWLDQELLSSQPKKENIFPVYQAPHNGLMILAINWGANNTPFIHNHLSWAIVGIASGIERNHFYQRLDDGTRPGYAKLEKIAEKDFGRGDICCMRNSALHSIENVSTNNQPAISLHLYRQNLDSLDRSQFDINNDSEQPYRINYD